MARAAQLLCTLLRGQPHALESPPTAQSVRTYSEPQGALWALGDEGASARMRWWVTSGPPGARRSQCSERTQVGRVGGGGGTRKSLSVPRNFAVSLTLLYKKVFTKKIKA